ncbi:hypothetical protein STEG23_025241 [Scotinomys teguina]
MRGTDARARVRMLGEAFKVVFVVLCDLRVWLKPYIVAVTRIGPPGHPGSCDRDPVTGILPPELVLSLFSTSHVSICCRTHACNTGCFDWEIIPRFGVPASLQSDNGPEFTSQVSQTLAKALNIPWHFRIPYRPQSSGKVECTNRSLKSILTKMSQELHLDWVSGLPPSLLNGKDLSSSDTYVGLILVCFLKHVMTERSIKTKPQLVSTAVRFKSTEHNGMACAFTSKC